MARLAIFRGDSPFRTVELSERDVRIGRAGQNDVVLEDPDKAVSRFHAELRYENGRYAIIDLNSQNGTWIEGQRIQRVVLDPGVTVMLGPYRLVLEAIAPVLGDTQSGASVTPAAPRDAGTLAGAPATPASVPATPATSDTLVKGRGTPAGGPPPAAAGPAPPPAKTAKSSLKVARPGQVPPRPGVIAAIARLPKPVVFGGFAVVVILIIALRVALTPGEPQQAQRTAQTTGQQTVEPGKETNEQIIARHLKEGQDLMQRGEIEAALRDHFDQILLINPDHPEALELKMKAEELLRQKQVAATGETGAGGVAGVGQPVTGTGQPPGATGQPATGIGQPPVTAGQPATGTAPAAGKGAAATAAGTKAASKEPGVKETADAARAAREKKAAAETGGVSRRPGESVTAWRARTRQLQDRYQSAKAALQDKDYQAAANLFEDILKEEPSYLDAPALLMQAHTGIRAAAQQAFDAGVKAEKDGDLVNALKQYERAQQLSASLPGLDEAMRRVRERARTEGEDAYKRARQYDALGRVDEARAMYEKALQLLPADSPMRKAARDRLDALKAGVR